MNTIVDHYDGKFCIMTPGSMCVVIDPEEDEPGSVQWVERLKKQRASDNTTINICYCHQQNCLFTPGSPCVMLGDNTTTTTAVNLRNVN